RADAIAQRSNRPIADGTIAELIDTAAAFDQRHTRGVVDAEFPFEAGLRRFFVGELYHEWMHLQFDAIDVTCCQFVFVPKLNATIDRRMHNDATSERFVRVLRNLERFTETLRDGVVIVSGAYDIRPTILRFETLFRARE